MPEEIPPVTDQNQQNADVARKQASQDINAPEGNKASTNLKGTSDALDALAAEVTKKHDDEPTPEEKAKAEADAAAEKEAADKKKEDAAAPKVEPTTPKEPADDVAKKTEDIFKGSPTLPPGASPKSAEAFSAVKTKAAQEITTRDKRILELETQVKERDEKLKNPIPDDVHKELEDLRSFKAKLDIEADPKFKEYDKTISSNQEFIYSQLLKSPAVDQKVIDKIKEIGGPDMVDMSKIFEAVKDPTIQRIVESKIADIEHAKWQKQEAVKTAKANASEYVKQREEQVAKSAQAHTEATRGVLNQLSAKALNWLTPKTVPDKADEATKKSVEDHNKFVTETKQHLEACLNDDSPEMRAIMMVATAQLLQIKREQATWASEKTSLEAKVKELTEKLDKFKSGSVSRIRESGASAGGASPKPADTKLNTNSGDALDKIRDQVMQERERARTGA